MREVPPLSRLGVGVELHVSEFKLEGVRECYEVVCSILKPRIVSSSLQWISKAVAFFLFTGVVAPPILDDNPAEF